MLDKISIIPRQDAYKTHNFEVNYLFTTSMSLQDWNLNSSGRLINTMKNYFLTFQLNLNVKSKNCKVEKYFDIIKIIKYQ